MTNETLRERAESIVSACDAALASVDAQPLTAEQRAALKATLVELYQRAQAGGRSAPSIVAAYNQTLAAIGEPQLTAHQRETLGQFFALLYEKAKDRKEGQGEEPPLVG